MEEKALAVFNKMATFLSQAPKLSVTIDTGYDAVQPAGLKVEFDETRKFTIRRPDRVRIDTDRRDGNQRGFVFDGKEIGVFDTENRQFNRQNTTQNMQNQRQTGATTREGMRQAGANDRLANRQDFTRENREDRQNYGSNVREDRQDYRDKARDEWIEAGDNHWGGGWNDWDEHPIGTGLAVGAAMAVGSAFNSMTCPAPVIINGAYYYNCGGAWYSRAYQGGSVTYIVVNAPPGY